MKKFSNEQTNNSQIHIGWGRKEAMASFSLAVFAFFFCNWAGNRQLGGYDLGMLIDVAWRQHLGQRPYQDFICTLPPGFYLPCRTAFALWGPRWDSLLWINACFAALVSFWVLWLVRALGYSLRLALLATSVCVSCLLLTTHWWHSTETSCLAVITLLSALLLQHRPHRISVFSFALSLGFLLLNKPNLAWPLGAALVLILSRCTARRELLLAVSGALLFVVCFLGAYGISVAQWLHNYTLVAGRAWPDKFVPEGLQPRDRFVFLLSIMLCLLPLVACLDAWWQKKAMSDAYGKAILSAGVLCGLYAMGTNWDIKLNDAPLVAISCALLAIEISRSSSIATQRTKELWVALCLVSVTVWSLYLGAIRYRSFLVGYATYFEWTLVDTHPDTPFFPHLKTGGRFHRTLKEIRAMIAAHPTKPVFFGPRLEWAYAALGITSPKGFPIWWHEGTSYGAAQEPDILQAWRQARIGVVFFKKGEDKLPAPPVMKEIENFYRAAHGPRDVTCFYRKTD